jgi:hypothetical protein
LEIGLKLRKWQPIEKSKVQKMYQNRQRVKQITTEKNKIEAIQHRSSSTQTVNHNQYNAGAIYRTVCRTAVQDKQSIAKKETNS